jgi:hypothetical protein
VGLAAARRAMLRSVADRSGNLVVRMRLPVSFIMGVRSFFDSRASYRS